MKRLLFIILLSNWLSPANGQFWDNNFIYYSGDVNFGNYLRGNQELNYIYKSKYSLKIGQTMSMRFAKSQPDDYSTGLIGGMFLQIPFTFDKIESYYISVGGVLNLNKKRTLRANLSIGGGYTTIKEPYNWQPVEDPKGLIPNYTYEYNKINKMSLILNPDLEFAFTRYFGVTLSPILEMNKDRIHFGIGIGIMAGLLREKNYP